MPEPLILKVQADTQGVPEGFNRIQRSADGLDISTRKASLAMKGFVQDLAQAKDGTDVASAALGAFSKILGTSLAATGIVIAGKAIIDSFQKVSAIVEETKDRIGKASADIKKAGIDISFSQAAGEAKRLSDEAETARTNIEKLDKSFLMGLIATITGAREELGKLAQDADKLSQQRLFEGARAERVRTEERAGLEGGALAIKDIQERLGKELQAVNILTPEGLAAANELRKRAELDIQAIQKKGQAEIDEKQAQQELKAIEADISGAKAAVDIEKKFDEEAAKKAEENVKKLEEQKAKKQEEIEKSKERAEKESIALQEKSLDAQERVDAARKRVVEADARIADILLGGTGTGRGKGQRASSAEVGAMAAAERAFQQESIRMAKDAYADFETEREAKNELSDRYAFNREQAKKKAEQARQRARDPFEEQRKARESLASSEKLLGDIKKSLEDNLKELKEFAHAK